MAIRKNISRQGADFGKGVYVFNISRYKYKIIQYLLMYTLLLGLFSGCAVTQDFQQPKVDIPQGWRIEYQESAAIVNTAWWEQFQDPVLNELITIALNENKDLRIAAARVEEFAARLKIGEAAFYPSINYGGGASREQRSLEQETSLSKFVDRNTADYRAVLDVGWEFDIWGRIRRSTEAARADLLSEEEGRQAVILTLVSAVAKNYIYLLSLDKKLEITQKAVASRNEWLQLFEKKDAGGQISGLELAQARASYERDLAHIPEIELQIALQENYISILTGRNPVHIKRSINLDKLKRIEIPQGIPSDLLIRRPDIRQSEQNLIAANARIGVVRTQYLPKISLTGLFGVSSSQLFDLMRSSAGIWEAGAQFAGPVFTAGRIKGEVNEAEAKQKQLLNIHLRTIQNAFREVDDSLVSMQKLRKVMEIKARHISALKDCVHYARNRYESGYSRYLEVMVSEKDLYDAEIAQAQIQNDIFAAMVSTYKAMGGGWIPEDSHQTTFSDQDTEPKKDFPL